MDVRFPPPKPKEKKPFNGEKPMFIAPAFAGISLRGPCRSGPFGLCQLPVLPVRSLTHCTECLGWTGVIAAVISFGGFTFFYWHTANKRMKEGWRALLFSPCRHGDLHHRIEVPISRRHHRALPPPPELTRRGRPNRAIPFRSPIIRATEAFLNPAFC
ncbi:MAG: hypothetical protein R3C04_07345 [Hyphomonas sp.]